MKVSVFTLGCKTNLYESQQIVAGLLAMGHDAVIGLCKADVFVLNTCAITAEAEKKSRQAIARARKLNPDCKVVVVGCASQKNAEQFADLDNVTFVKGVHNKEGIVKLLDSYGVDVEQIPSVYAHTINAVQERTRAFVKVQDGCNNFCSYCIVPYLRGRSRSKDVDVVVDEVANANSNEVVLIGIDLSQYGKDNGSSLEQLFSRLQGLPVRIRLGSLEPNVVTEQMLTALSKLNFCPHFHLSLQSGCDSVLSRMNRHYTTQRYYDAVQQIRKVFPGVAITTDVIVGFCGETDEEFEATCQFVQKVGFADIHVFPYSPREGTVAYNTMADLPAYVKKRRQEALTAIKHQLHGKFVDSQLGKVETVLAEQKKGGFWQGYTPNYTRVYFKGDVKCGDLVQVKLTKRYLDGAEGELV